MINKTEKELLKSYEYAQYQWSRLEALKAKSIPVAEALVDAGYLVRGNVFGVYRLTDYQDQIELVANTQNNMLKMLNNVSQLIQIINNLEERVAVLEEVNNG